MTPLTLACARCRRLLTLRRDGPLAPEDQEALEQHLAGCEGCRAAEVELERAFDALSALTPDDIARLSAPQAVDGSRLGAVTLVALAATVLVAVAGVMRSGQPAPDPAPAVAAAPAPGPGTTRLRVVLPDAQRPPPVDAVASPPEPPPAEPPPAAAAAATAEPPATAEVAPQVAPEPEPLAIAAPAAPDAAAPSPAPAPAPAPQPGRPAAQPVPAPAALPGPIGALLARAEVSQGLRYRDLTFYWVRDAGGRDRIASAAGPAAPARAREAEPPTPDRCSVAPASRGADDLLLGELLDTDAALRVAVATVPLRGSRQPVAAVALGSTPSPRRGATLPAAVLVPSAARGRLIEGELQREDLTARLGSLTGLDSLVTVARRIEPEARELERRLRARVRATRGLRGLGLSIGGRARSLDLFADANHLSGALPRLVRAALVEAALESEPAAGEAETGTPQDSLAIRGGETATRDVHRGLLALARFAEATELSAPGGRGCPGAIYRQRDARGAAWVVADGETLRHAVLVPVR